MSDSIAQLIASLQLDPWRNDVGFSPDLRDANERLFDSAADEQELINTLSGWLQKCQPCLFGRMAAKAGFLSYCILTEADLASSDDTICAKIQAARKAWTKAGFEGGASGFIILAISKRLSSALPDDTVKAIALRLCSLYLLEEVKPDAVCLDDVWLEMPGRGQTTWKWHAGVNYFCAQGDKRWWQDHRIPGGMAFSVNSVGHLVKSGILARGMMELEKSLKAPAEGYDSSKVHSLGQALEWAMRTIAMAAETISGKATELLTLPLDDDGKTMATSPVPLPPSLFRMNFSEYLGYYHTDYTVPSEFFRPEVERPKGLQKYLLDFTYLFRRDVENFAFTTMGEGQQIREDDAIRPRRIAKSHRRLQMEEQVVRIDEQARLLQALAGR